MARRPPRGAADPPVTAGRSPVTSAPRRPPDCREQSAGRDWYTRCWTEERSGGEGFGAKGGGAVSLDDRVGGERRRRRRCVRRRTARELLRNEWGWPRRGRKRE